MRLTGSSTRPLEVPAWRVDAAQLLEEHHLVAWSPLPAQRAMFTHDLAEHLAHFDDTQVCVIDGASIRDLADLAYALSHVLGVGHIAPALAGPRGIVESLRARPFRRGKIAIKRRYYIWNDADTMLRQNHRVFGQVVDAIAGIAAEAEYASEDLLLLHRAVFVGSTVLDVYAEDPRGQFRRWWSDEGEDDERPFWDVVTGIPSPVFLRYRIEDSLAA